MKTTGKETRKTLIRVWYSRQPAFNWVVATEVDGKVDGKWEKADRVEIHVPCETEKREKAKDGGNWPPRFVLKVPNARMRKVGATIILECEKEDSCV